MTEVKKSDVHGYGVFATTDIATGTDALSSIFIEVTGSNLKTVRDYCFAISKARQALPLDRAAIINHSDQPNVKWTERGDHLVFTAIRDIKSGEELFHNYGFCRFKKGS